jgi:hypothetical protein
MGPVAQRSCGKRSPDGDGSCLSFRLRRLGLGVLDRALRALEGLLGDEDAVHRGGSLETGGGVDDVAGSHRLARVGPGGEVDECLTRRDADPQLDPL